MTKGLGILGTKLCATAQELLLDIKVGRLFDSETRPEPSWQDRPSPQTAWTLPRSSRHLVPIYTFIYSLPPGSSSPPTSTSSPSSTLFRLDHLLPLPLLHHLHLLLHQLSPQPTIPDCPLFGDRYPGPLRHHHLLRRHPLGEASSFLSMHLVFISEINVYNPYLSFI